MHMKFHSTPTCTFKGRTQLVSSSNRPEAYPGPNQYTYDKPHRHHGAATIGRQKRQVFSIEGYDPGPGKYLQKSYISQGPKPSISSKHQIKTEITPSPQAYSPKYKKLINKSPAYSMGVTKKTLEWTRKESAVEPSPFSYNPQMISTARTSRVGFSKRKGLSDFEKTPGPAAYNTASTLISKQNPRASIGSAARRTVFDALEENQSQKPGPGKYESSGFVDEDSKHHRGYTMRAVTEDLSLKYRSELPGPGRYTIENENQRRKGYACATDKRMTFIDKIMSENYTPAPGEYTFRGKSTPKTYSFSNSKRKDLSDHEKTPGPAIYNSLNSSLSLLAKAPRCSMGKSPKGLSKAFNIYETTPGPCKYNPNYNVIRQSSRTSRVSQSKWYKQGKGLDSPGVGIYNIQQQSSSPSGGFKFSQQKRKSFTESSSRDEYPSPVHYDTRGLFPNPPRYMMNGSYRCKV